MIEEKNSLSTNGNQQETQQSKSEDYKQAIIHNLQLTIVPKGTIFELYGATFISDGNKLFKITYRSDEKDSYNEVRDENGLKGFISNEGELLFGGVIYKKCRIKKIKDQLYGIFEDNNGKEFIVDINGNILFETNNGYIDYIKYIDNKIFVIINSSNSSTVYDIDGTKYFEIELDLLSVIEDLIIHKINGELYFEIRKKFNKNQLKKQKNELSQALGERYLNQEFQCNGLFDKNGINLFGWVYEIIIVEKENKTFFGIRKNIGTQSFIFYDIDGKRLFGNYGFRKNNLSFFTPKEIYDLNGAVINDNGKLPIICQGKSNTIQLMRENNENIEFDYKKRLLIDEEGVQYRILEEKNLISVALWKIKMKISGDFCYYYKDEDGNIIIPTKKAGETGLKIKYDKKEIIKNFFKNITKKII